MSIMSVAIVALNEERFLPNLLDDILKQSIDLKKVELLLIDSKSTDSTKQIFNDFKNINLNKFYNIIVLDNVNIKQSCGWNVAIKNFTGDTLTRIDAHSRLDYNFLRNVSIEINNGENVVGGLRPCIIENKNWWTNLLISVENSLFGSSVNASKHSKKKLYVKTLFHATYKRKVLNDVGYFNEYLGRTEDNEMHYRIRKRGYKICYSPDIISYQYARVSLRKMIKQKYSNGYWIGRTLKYCPKCLSLYHFIPLAFLFGIIFTTVLCFYNFWYLSVLMWTLYVLFAFVGMYVSIRYNKVKYEASIMPFMFLILHLSYGLGTLMGIIDFRRIGI